MGGTGSGGDSGKSERPAHLDAVPILTLPDLLPRRKVGPIWPHLPVFQKKLAIPVFISNHPIFKCLQCIKNAKAQYGPDKTSTDPGVNCFVAVL